MTTFPTRQIANADLETAGIDNPAAGNGDGVARAASIAAQTTANNAGTAAAAAAAQATAITASLSNPSPGYGDTVARRGIGDRLRRLSRSGAAPTVNATPPTVTLNTSSSITGRSGNSAYFTDGSTLVEDLKRYNYFGGTATKLAFGGTNWLQWYSINYNADGSLPSTGGGDGLESWVDAPIFEVIMSGNGGFFRLYYDDKLVSSSLYTIPATGDYYVKIDNSANSTVVKAHKLRIEVGVGVIFKGIKTAPIYNVWAPPPFDLSLLIAGDSYTEGTIGGASPQAFGMSGFPNYLAWYLNVSNRRISGSGGTGWSKATSRCNMKDRWQLDVIAPAPEVAVIAMGINDGQEPSATVLANATSCVASFRAALPNSLLFLVSSWSPIQSAVPAIDAAIASAAASDTSGKTFFINTSPTGDFWLTGTSGNTSAPAGLGNADVFMTSADATHPIELGHNYLARRLADSIMAAVKLFP